MLYLWPQLIPSRTALKDLDLEPFARLGPRPPRSTSSNPAPRQPMAESTPPKLKPEAPLIETLESLSTALQSLQLRIGLLTSSADRVLTLSDVQSLQAHLLKFSKKLDDPVPKLRCPECTARFHRLDRLFAHCQTYHPDRDYLRLVCSCPKTFKYLRQRNEHMRIEHRDEYENERLLIEKRGLDG